MSAISQRGEWAACAAVARHALHSFANQQSSLPIRAMVICALLLVLAGFVVEATYFKPLMIGAIFFLFLLLVVVWAALFRSLAEQNRVPGHLVPGIGRRSTKVLVLAWLAIMACLTAPIAALGVPAAFTGAILGAILVTGALLVVRPQLALVVLFGMVAPILIHTYLTPLHPDLVLGWRVLLGLWGAFMAVRTMLDGKSTGIVELSLTQFAVRQQARGVTATYARALRRDSANGNGAALLLHCLGPIAARPLMFSALLVVPVIALAYAVSVVAPSLAALYQAKGDLRVILLMSAIASLLLHVDMVSAAVRKSAGEQALLMLTVRRPEPAAINKLLGGALMLRYACLWTVVTLMVLGVSAALTVPAAELVWMLVMLIITLAGGTLLLQNYAKAEHGITVSAVLLGAGAAVTVAAAVYVDFDIIVGALFAALCAVATLLIFVLRWTAMSRAPVAFPARRYA